MSQYMSPEEFGTRLVQTGDLDPVYIGVWNAQLPEAQAHRWMLAYWMFYHMGVASYLSEYREAMFWNMALRAAENTVSPPIGGRWPRGSERRHFRGQKAVDAVRHLSYQNPEHHVRGLYFSGCTAKEVMDQVQAWPMFGPWIAFKAADMIDRCLGVPVQFPKDVGLMYSEPRKALDIMLSETTVYRTDVQEVGTYPTRESLYSDLLAHFRGHPAPPVGDRPCGPAEVESVLCKWKSYRNGHYWVGRDIHETRLALVGWGETASKILTHMPQEVVR